MSCIYLDGDSGRRKTARMLHRVEAGVQVSLISDKKRVRHVVGFVSDPTAEIKTVWSPDRRSEQQQQSWTAVPGRPEPPEPPCAEHVAQFIAEGAILSCVDSEAIQTYSGDHVPAEDGRVIQSLTALVVCVGIFCAVSAQPDTSSFKSNI